MPDHEEIARHEHLDGQDVLQMGPGPLRQMRPYGDLFLLGSAFLLLETRSITGFALLVLVYYLGAASFLVDPRVSRLSPGAGVAVGVWLLRFSTALPLAVSSGVASVGKPRPAMPFTVPATKTASSVQSGAMGSHYRPLRAA